MAIAARNATRRRLFFFVLVGGLGFLIDAGVLHALVFWLHLNVFASRAGSFLCGMTATWLANRTHTFAAGRRAPAALAAEWLRYFGASLLGGACNYGAFVLAFEHALTVRSNPIIGVGIGSLTGMVVNYLLYSRFVFLRAR
jgi:putative flippase GtrA